jgi:hypothetical protein
MYCECTPDQTNKQTNKQICAYRCEYIDVCCIFSLSLFNEVEKIFKDALLCKKNVNLIILSTFIFSRVNGILQSKLFWPTVRKKCSSDREKLLKFEAEGQEFAKILRSLEKFIQTVKGRNNFW